MMLGDIKLIFHHRIASRVFVHVRRPVTNPLTGDKNRELDVELELDHFKRRRVEVPHEIADKPAVFVNGFGPFPVRDARSLDDRFVSSHKIDEPDKARVEAFILFI